MQSTPTGDLAHGVKEEEQFLYSMHPVSLFPLLNFVATRRLG